MDGCGVARDGPSSGRHGLLRWGVAALLASGAARAEGVGDEWTYRVVSGDTLYTFARDYLAPGIGWQKLQRLNQVADPRHLAPGRSLRMPIAWLRAEATVATVAFVAGTARRQRDGGEAALALGDQLQPGDTLVTEADANVTLRLADMTRVLVAGGSRVRIDSLLVLGRSGAASSQLGIDRGEIESQVPPGAGSRYQIRTPVLTLGVRGTEFRVRVGPDATTAVTEVTQGRVAARTTAGGRPEQPVAAGFGVLADAARGITVAQALLPAPGPAADLPPVDRVPLRLAWTAAPGAAAYRAQVLAAANADQRLLDGVFPGPAAQWADLPDGRYVLQVRSRDAQGFEGAAVALPFTLKARPEPPFTSAPRDGARVYGDRAELGWTRSTAAQRYRLQVASDAGFRDLKLDRDDLDADRLALALPPGSYVWRLASIAAGGDLGPFSDASRFELRATPPSPAVEAPAAQGGQLVFRWRARDDVAAYELQVASDPAFTQVITERRTEAPELMLATPPAGTYYLRVRAIEADGFVGPYGTAQQFEVPRGPWWWIVPGVVVLLLWL